MDNQMFCFQCEQTAGCNACTGRAGVCGKPLDVAVAQDELTGALIAHAQTCQAANTTAENTDALLIDGLFACVTNVDFDKTEIEKLTAQVHAATAAVAAAGNVEAAADYDMNRIWNADEDIRSLKSLVLFGIRGMAAYAYHARALGYTDETVNSFFREALAALAAEGSMESLLPLVLKVGEVNLACMGLLDKANTETYGTPEPTPVSMKIEKGPFIVISGHDLHDLKLLLEQTEGTGVNVYTHGEMLPAHAYPELKKYPQLKGNFGTAWQNQKKEFDGVPAAFLFTTNCLMPPKESYADNVFTTEVVAFPGCTHIGPDKDFGPVIQKALELGGYDEPHTIPGINGGTTMTTRPAPARRGQAADVADAQDDTVRCGRGRPVRRICDLIVDGLFTCMTNVNFDGQAVTALKDAVRVETAAVAAAAGIEPVSDYDVDQIWGDDEDIRSLKSLVLFGLRGTAAYAYHARVLGYRDATVDEFFADALAQLAEPGSVDALLPLALKVGEVNLGCMRLLDEANTGTYGTPEPTTVAMEVEPGPFIVISGHDLHDLKLLLEQTEGTGVTSTHSEMLPAHAYPELKSTRSSRAISVPRGRTRRRSSTACPRPSCSPTASCLPRSYADNVFTTEVVAFPGCTRTSARLSRRRWSWAATTSPIPGIN